jgi:hypothetical protein
MLKVTPSKLFALLFLFFINACSNTPSDTTNERANAALDSLTEVIIDSAYAATIKACDSLFIHQVPIWAKQISKKDSIPMQHFTDSMQEYAHPISKVEKVIKQVKIDCALSLRTETYRRALQLQN